MSAADMRMSAADIGRWEEDPATRARGRRPAATGVGLGRTAAIPRERGSTPAASSRRPERGESRPNRGPRRDVSASASSCREPERVRPGIASARCRWPAPPRPGCPAGQPSRARTGTRRPRPAPAAGPRPAPRYQRTRRDGDRVRNRRPCGPVLGGRRSSEGSGRRTGPGPRPVLGAGLSEGVESDRGRSERRVDLFRRRQRLHVDLGQHGLEGLLVLRRRRRGERDRGLDLLEGLARQVAEPGSGGPRAVGPQFGRRRAAVRQAVLEFLQARQEVRGPGVHAAKPFGHRAGRCRLVGRGS